MPENNQKKEFSTRPISPVPSHQPTTLQPRLDITEVKTVRKKTPAERAAWRAKQGRSSSR